KKVRNFVEDPHLKFHFSTTSRMADILNKGVLSYEFAKRTGIELNENMSSRNGGISTKDNSISIVDREKNPGNDRKDDWWIKQFSVGQTNVGFLLPNNIKINSETPQPNESLVSIRIKPKQFEGIFITERSNLDETIKSLRERSIEKYPGKLSNAHNYGVYFLNNFFGYTNEKIKSLDPEIGILDKKIQEIYEKNNFLNRKSETEWPKEIRQELEDLEQEQIKKMEERSMLELEKIIQKPSTEINEKDLFIYFAKKHELPLYFVSQDFKTQKVVWPN
ncbi:MAG: hypothetical protein AAB438_02595, partial [Patescibacteria group bacterium]